MSKECVFASGAPAALGPYSHANKAGNFIFASGQLGLDPATGALVEGDVKAQAESEALQNLAIVLKASGCSLSDVVKTTVFLKDIRDFAAVNEVYGSFFQKDFSRPQRHPGSRPPQRRACRNRSNCLQGIAL